MNIVNSRASFKKAKVESMIAKLRNEKKMEPYKMLN